MKHSNLRINQAQNLTRSCHGITQINAREHCFTPKLLRRGSSRGSWNGQIAAVVSGDDLPKSFDQSLTQACESVQMMVPSGTTSRKRRFKGIKRLSVEIPAIDTGIDQTMILVSKLLTALQEGGRIPATVLFSREDYVSAARERLPSNPVGLLRDAVDRNISINSRLLVFSPQPDDEERLFALLDDVWRGEAVLLCNPEFSTEFQAKRTSFVSAFNTVYCFMPLAIKVFIISK